MIILDANVLIAYGSRDDPHHDAAVSLLNEFAGQPFAASAVTRAEVLVHPVKKDTVSTALAGHEALELRFVDLRAEVALDLARVRASTGLRLPDAVVVLLARQLDGIIATFDAGLARGARSEGIPVVGDES
ncbi:type II toxin-antitoxin system VapC family toxin [Frondihabitans australicus]|uniref:Ribonuclease VapC n=1 Tax=Frondihabitans australicus TaxID=386892 RepID=A0A495IKS2_9MICO|nr:type II toxin-antitoxin system VapC family toxin [Frondihabitans australicus]RKR76577.1 putative nucleic acid-binding protein [Frondihabitans australicus]